MRGHRAGRGKGLSYVVFEISRAERRFVYFGEERRDFGRAADRFVIVGYGMRRRSVPVLDARVQRHVASHSRSIAQHHGERHARRGPNGVFHPTPHLRRHHLNWFDAVLGSRAPGSRRKLGRLRAVPSAHGARDAPSKRRTTVLSHLVAHRRFRRRNHHHLLARSRLAHARRDDVEPSFQLSLKINEHPVLCVWPVKIPTTMNISDFLTKPAEDIKGGISHVDRQYAIVNGTFYNTYMSSTRLCARFV